LKEKLMAAAAPSQPNLKGIAKPHRVNGGIGITCVGGDWDNVNAVKLAFDSKKSLIDYDTVVFTLGAPGITSSPKPGGWLAKALQHWRTELAEVLKRGGTAFVICDEPFKVEVTTGSVKKDVSSYSFLPMDLKIISKRGDVVRPCQTSDNFSLKKHAGILRYVVVIQAELDNYLFETRGGEYKVGGIKKFGAGNLVLLPVPHIHGLLPDGVPVNHINHKEAQEQFLRSLVEFAEELRAPTRDSAPAWIKDSYRPALRLSNLLAEAEDAAAKIERLKSRIEAIQLEGADLLKFEVLLYGKGDQLEEVVRVALSMMGFAVEKYDQEDLRFDLVAISAEGRFLGEVEGKDNTHIDVTKIRQLSGNIDEDYNREDILEPAHGVLFGNAFRKIAPSERGDFFTQKVLLTAARRKIALVRTPDLMPVVQSILDGASEDYKAACRKAIFDSEGKIVTFPAAPMSSVVG
jgi:hypothetical protein